MAISPTNERLPGGGETGALIRGHDWGQTPLGPIAQWPQSLRTVVGILMGSRYAMWMGWGPQLSFLCNDAYAPTLGVKRGWAIGRPSQEVWAEIWPDIGPRIETVLRTGEATWDEGLLLFLERSGYPEETYHTFSYSPLRDDTGAVAGHLCVVTEETERVIGARRLATLRELASALAGANAEGPVLEATSRAAAANQRDLPFTLTYLFDNAATARLAAATGIAEGHAAAPAEISAGDPHAAWPAAAMLTGAIQAGAEPVLVGNLAARFTDLPTGAWDRPPDSALVVPIAHPGQERPAGFLVAGLNPYRRHDAAYPDFVGLFAGQLAGSLGNARAYDAERRRATELAELDRTKTAFFSNVSHEFRTPLTLMLAPIEELLARPPEGDTRGGRPLLQVAHRNALRLLKLVNTLLDFSRIEAGRAEAVYQPTDLAAFTADLAASFRAAAERAGLSLTVVAAALPAPVVVDRDMWEKIVLNLVSNAFKFTFAGGITVAVRDAGTEAEVEVRDTGTGIAAHELPRLFERFHRIEGARGRTFEGSGIGLALVQELVRLHGGSIAVASELDRGSSFTVRLPYGRDHLPAEQVRNRGQDATGAARIEAFVGEALSWLDATGEPTAFDAGDLPAAPVTPDAGRPRVLLADDNADMRSYVARLLAVEYQVTAVPDGAAALAAARLSRPDLIISDVMMPRLDGFGLVREVRADPALRDVPVILLSARAGQEARLEGLQSGADDYVAKPFASRELMARVAANLTLARARREGEDRLLLALEAGDLGTFTIDIATGQRSWTPRMLHLFGISPGAGTPTLDEIMASVHAEDRDRVAAGRAAALRGEAPLREDFRVVRPDGSVHWLRIEGVARRDAQGQPRQLIGVVRDVTEQRTLADAQQRMTEALEREVGRQTQERDRMWRLSRELMAVTRLDGTLVAVNPAWTELLGWRETELIGRGTPDFLHPDDLAYTARQRTLMAAGQAPPRFENRLRRSDGAYRWLSWTAIAADGLIYSMGRDVTEQKAAAEELEVANRLLLTQIAEREQVESTLRQMQRLEAVGQLTSGVAHDFNNLLTVILGNLEFLRRADPSPQQARRLDMMQQAAVRGADLTAQLLAFSRRQRLEPKPADLNQVVGNMVDLLTSTLGGTVRLTTALTPDLWWALVDQTQIELAILNLAINARDAMPDGGTLTIATGAETIARQPGRRPEEPGPGHYVTVSVADTGTGMTPEVLAKAFEPFFTTKGVGKGSGLGLAQVFGFAKQSDGGVRIDTVLGKGSRITLYLPRAANAGSGEDSEAMRGGGRSVSNRQVILLVDDDAGVREVTAAMLDEMGYAVVEAQGGAAALDAIGQRLDIALLLVDFAMLDMTGPEVARKALALRPDLPVLFVTGSTDAAGLAEFDEARVIAKPFRDDQLRRKVSLALASSATAGIGNVVRLRPQVGGKR